MKDEVVQDILEHLDAKSKEIIRDTPEQDLISFLHNWGRDIQNQYNLLQNLTLLTDIGKDHPDDASMVIIEAVWKALQEEEKHRQSDRCIMRCELCGEPMDNEVQNDPYTCNPCQEWQRRVDSLKGQLDNYARLRYAEKKLAKARKALKEFGGEYEVIEPDENDLEF